MSQITKEHRIIAFIDILGFKNLVKDQENIEKILKLLEEIRKLNSQYKRYYEEKTGKTFLQIALDVISFSDHIILSLPLTSTEKYASQREYSIFSHYFYPWIMKLQKDFLQKGFLMRGAIACGDIYYAGKNNIVVGESLNEAIEDETKLAIYPRIIISKSLMDHIKKIHKDDHIAMPFLQKDFDGLYFTPYLSHSNKDQLKEIKLQIEKSILKAKNDFRAIQKWLWLVTHFNNLIVSEPIKFSGIDRIKTRILDI